MNKVPALVNHSEPGTFMTVTSNEDAYLGFFYATPEQVLFFSNTSLISSDFAPNFNFLSKCDLYHDFFLAY